MPPAQRQSGRRAEAALKQAAASLLASPGKAGRAADDLAAQSHQQQASGEQEPEDSSGSLARPQPAFLSPGQSPSSKSARPAAPDIGADLSALLRQADSPGGGQLLDSPPVLEGAADIHGEPGAERDAAGSPASAGAEGSEGGIVEALARDAAEASRQALAALGPPEDSPRSPAAQAGAQQLSQQGFQAEVDAAAADNAAQEAGSVQDAQGAAGCSAAQGASTESSLARTTSTRQQPSTQTASQLQSRSQSQRSQSQHSQPLRSLSRSSGAKAKRAPGKQRDPDALSQQKSIMAYFSPRAKG